MFNVMKVINYLFMSRGNNPCYYRRSAVAQKYYTSVRNTSVIFILRTSAAVESLLVTRGGYTLTHTNWIVCGVLLLLCLRQGTIWGRDRQTDREKEERLTERRDTQRETHAQTNREKRDRQTKRERERDRERQTDRAKRDRLTERRDTERDTHKQTERRETDRQRERKETD